MTNARIDVTNERIETGFQALRTEVKQVIVESEMRTATAVNEATHSVREVFALVRDRIELRGRVERCVREIDAHKRKIRKND
jgi:hypothetical protein